MICSEPIDRCDVGEVAGPLVAVGRQIDVVAQHASIVGIANSGEGLGYNKGF